MDGSVHTYNDDDHHFHLYHHFIHFTYFSIFVGMTASQYNPWFEFQRWKWKWPNSVGKSKMSLSWCISFTNNVKSWQKFNETAPTINFTDFTLIFWIQNYAINFTKFLRAPRILLTTWDWILRSFWHSVLNKDSIMLFSGEQKLFDHFSGVWKSKYF